MRVIASDEQHQAASLASLIEEIQKDSHELKLRVEQLEADRLALEQEGKALRVLLERSIDQRLRSHSELVAILATLVSKLPIHDVGGIVSRLVEHNTNVSQALAALTKVTAEAELPRPEILKALDQTKRDLLAAVKQAAAELARLDPPLERGVLESLSADPELFFSARMVRANRCFAKGQVPRERVVREFGEEALMCFKDMTTDPKLNPRPKPEEIMLAFRNDFEALFQQQPALMANKRGCLEVLYQQVQRSRAPTDQARAQRAAFQRLSYLVELLHYYEHQNTEAPEVVFAHRLPALVEQLGVAGPQAPLDEGLIRQVEALLALVISSEHRLMIVNNVGKNGGVEKTLKYVLRLRGENVADLDRIVAEFVRHLIPPPPESAPSPQALGAVLRLLRPEVQRRVAKAILGFDRIPKADARALGKALGAELGLTGFAAEAPGPSAPPPEAERQLAWANIKDLVTKRTDAAAIAGVIRDRLHAKYDADEIRQSWLTLTETDPMSLIKICCQLPFRADGKTDPIARTVMESYVTRLTHEKYAGTYHKIVNTLRTMFQAKPDSATLHNFVALVKWVSPEAAIRLCADVGMREPTE
jgi:Txe/YoeB family toxin of Txe-Axe toxin-antitoxin module